MSQRKITQKKKQDLDISVENALLERHLKVAVGVVIRPACVCVCARVRE